MPVPPTRRAASWLPRAASVETTRPTAAASTTNTPSTRAAFHTMCGDAQTSRRTEPTTITHGSARRWPGVSRRVPRSPALGSSLRRIIRTRISTRMPMIGSITSVTAAPAPSCSCWMAFE